MTRLGAAHVMLAVPADAFLAPAPEVKAADVVVFRGDTYAAIAYSPATGRIGYAYNAGSRLGAELAALRKCRADDARIVCWVNNGFCALAVSRDGSVWGTGWSYGDGSSNTSAKLRALAECRRRAGSARLVLCLCSANYAPEEF